MSKKPSKTRGVSRRARRWYEPGPAQPFKAPTSFATSVELLRLPPDLPEVRVAPRALYKMYVLVDATRDEVGWLGTARWEGRTLLVEDVFLFEQEAGRTHTEITIAALEAFALELLQSEDGLEKWNNLRFWGHSHGTMAAFASYQDDRQMAVFHENGCDWFLRGILNRNGQIRFCLYLWNEGMAVHEVPWRLADEPELAEEEKEAIRASLTAEFKEKVRQPPSKFSWPSYLSRRGEGSLETVFETSSFWDTPPSVTPPSSLPGGDGKPEESLGQDPSTSSGQGGRQGDSPESEETDD